MYIKVKVVRAKRNPHYGLLINLHKDKKKQFKIRDIETTAGSTEHLPQFVTQGEVAVLL
jgi:hypothetical protein